MYRWLNVGHLWIRVGPSSPGSGRPRICCQTVVINHWNHIMEADLFHFSTFKSLQIDLIAFVKTKNPFWWSRSGYFPTPDPSTHRWRVFPGQASRSQCSGATAGKLTWSTPTALTWGQTWPWEDGCWGTVSSARSTGGSFRAVTASACGFLMLKKVNENMNAAIQSQGRYC